MIILIEEGGTYPNRTKIDFKTMATCDKDYCPSWKSFTSDVEPCHQIFSSRQIGQTHTQLEDAQMNPKRKFVD